MISACAAALTSLSAKVSWVVPDGAGLQRAAEQLLGDGFLERRYDVVRPMDDCSASVVRPCVVLETDGLALTPGLRSRGACSWLLV